MSASNATITPTNIVLTPMRVTFNGVDLGSTEGGVEINIKPAYAPKHADQLGSTKLDEVVSGYDIKVKTILAEVTKDNWKVSIPSANEIVNGGTKSIYLDSQVGSSALALSHALLLHPLSLADGDLSGDYKFYKAAVTSAVPIKYGPDKQSGLAIEWHIFPDTSVVPAKFLTIGDPSNGATAASAGSATPGSNTGNGTIGTIAVSNTATRTETITVTCVGATTGNDFFVSGSVSGALGECHVGATSTNTVNFVPTSGSPQVITFTITQGSVQFAKGDSFTIATVASNYA